MNRGLDIHFIMKSDPQEIVDHSLDRRGRNAAADDHRLDRPTCFIDGSVFDIELVLDDRRSGAKGQQWLQQKHNKERSHGQNP